MASKWGRTIPRHRLASHAIGSREVDKVREGSDLPCHWWTVFQDPDLEELIRSAANQNLTLREAGFRILEARAALGIARGELFPQRQGGGAGYQRIVLSGAKTDGLTGTHALFFDEWGDGFNLVWEIDFWGRFRRAVTAAEDTLDASVAGYDEALVTLYGDVASAYVAARTLEQTDPTLPEERRAPDQAPRYRFPPP